MQYLKLKKITCSAQKYPSFLPYYNDFCPEANYTDPALFVLANALSTLV